MKKGDFVLIGAIVAAVAAVLFFSMSGGDVSSDSIGMDISSDSIDADISSGMSYVMAEVEDANVADDCLVIFEGGVYDLTPMIEAGKHKPVDKLCGTDITESGAHGDYLTSKLEKYYVGELR